MSHDDHQPGEPGQSEILKALLYREIDHHGPQGELVHRVRQQIEPQLSEIGQRLHDDRALKAGDQWTIPIGMSCGFEGELVIRISDPGPDHRARRHELG